MQLVDRNLNCAAGSESVQTSSLGSRTDKRQSVSGTEARFEIRKCELTNVSQSVAQRRISKYANVIKLTCCKFWLYSLYDSLCVDESDRPADRLP